MKRCKDCKHQNDLEIDGYTACPFMKICQNNDRNMYTRKWWKFWAPKVLLITLALLLGGCTQHILTLPDGSTYKSNRFLDWTKIGSVSYDNGSFVLKGYESDLTKALGVIDRLLAEYEEMFEQKRMAVK